MCSCFRFWQYMLAVFLLLSCGLYVTAGVVNYWWVNNAEFFGVRSVSEAGLWKVCQGSGQVIICVERNDILQFGDKYLDHDIVLVALIVAASLTLLPLLFVVFTMCQRYPSKMTIVIGFFFMFFGMASGVFGTIWALTKISAKNQGWAFFCLYGADGFAVLAFVLCLIILLCMKAPGAYRTTNRDDEIAMLAR